MSASKKGRDLIRFIEQKTQTTVVSSEWRGSGHRQVVFMDEGGRMATVILPGTPTSGKCGSLNYVAHVRRSLRNAVQTKEI